MQSDFLNQAEAAILGVLKDVRPELMENYGKIDFETKHDQTVVTHLDKMVEQKLREVLKKLDPSIGIEGEEFGIEGSRETYWLVDPIDGTEQFIRGIPSCKNLLALIRNGEVVWSMMYMFAKDELWLARTGGGTTCNGQKITMRHRPLNRCWIEISVNVRNQANVEALQRVRSKTTGFTIMRDPGFVAGGKVDGLLSLEAEGKAWDYAPRSLLYSEAGAKIANIGSDSYNFHNNDFLVAHPDNFDELMKLVTG
jgi:fructose-1,6-bisphosphatase/inositol monophosphatase family enzyme